MRLLQVGDEVRIHKKTDESIKWRSLIKSNAIGKVTKIVTDDVGATAKDPLYYVEFTTQQGSLIIDAFWREELRRVRPKPPTE